MLGLMCLAQGHNAVTPVRLEPGAPQSQVKHSTTEPLHSHPLILCTHMKKFIYIIIHRGWSLKVGPDLDPNCLTL